MPNPKVLAGSSRLKETTRALRDQWRQMEDTWSDAVRRRFEERYLDPIEPAVDAAVNGLRDLAEILDQMRRDCSDRSEIP